MYFSIFICRYNFLFLQDVFYYCIICGFNFNSRFFEKFEILYKNIILTVQILLKINI